jgi:hypothetical protein
VLTAGAVAQAQSGGKTTQQAPDANDKAERHCVAGVLEAGSDEAARVDPLAEPPVECFGTFREAVKDATGGRIKDAPNDASEAARNKAFRDKLSAPGQQKQQGGGISTQAVDGNNTVGCCVVLSVEYEHADYRGNTLTYAAGHGCIDDGRANYVLPNIGSKWNDEISSFVGANRCDLRHFQHANYGGICYPNNGVGGCYTLSSDANMGYFNDQTTSIRWY